MGEGTFDLLIVGGGINGCGIARDAVGRGFKVLLVERDDLAAHTSSASTKMIHGGLRYLEQFEFRLVRESLIERERLLRIAPHIIRPLDFVIPQATSPRPAWMVRLGLLIYDHLGARKTLPATRTIQLDNDPRGSGLVARRGKAFVYSDCRVDDSRLVILNALDAAELGAKVRTRTELLTARRQADEWIATLRDGSRERQVRARALVNATGPWVNDLLGRLGDARPRRNIRLVKGSHIVLSKLYAGEHGFLIQNSDRRVVFAIPFEDEFTLVGTTEVWWDRPPGIPTISEEETGYLLDTVARTFAGSVGAADVRWAFSGIRPLYDDHSSTASAVTRDYVLDLDSDGAPLLSVYGGKITTYRRLAEQAIERLSRFFPRVSGSWTGCAALPGGDFPEGMESHVTRLGARYPFLSPAQRRRLTRSYGSRAEAMLGDARTSTDLGERFGSEMTAREADYLVEKELARTAHDILFRRSKLGLSTPAEAVERLEQYVRARLARA